MFQTRRLLKMAFLERTTAMSREGRRHHHVFVRGRCQLVSSFCNDLQTTPGATHVYLLIDEDRPTTHLRSQLGVLY